MPARKTMFLVDGSNQAFRAFFAIQTDMRGQDDFPTRALYGFNSMLDKLLREHKPDYLCVLFDKGLSFRNDLFPDYKGQRPDMPEDLRKQWPEFIPFCEERGVSALAIEGFEADDIIGTLAKKHAGPEIDVFVVSSDKDFAQLVDPHIKLFDVAKNNLYGVKDVEEKWGVRPDRIIDLLALMGDKSDNIPGAHGVGPKTAVKYLQKWPSARAVVDAALKGEIKGKTGQKVAAHAAFVDLSVQLATIKTDIPDDVVNLSLEDLVIGDEDLPALEKRLKRYNFRRFLRRVQDDLGEQASTRVSIDRSTYKVVDTAEGLQRLIRDLYEAGRFAVDLETTSLNELEAQVVGIAFCYDPAFAVYVPVAHEGGGNCPDALTTLAPVLADPNLGKVGQNLKYDLKVLRARGYDLQGIVSDTMLAHYLLRVDQRHGLDDQAVRRLDHKMLAYKDVTKDVGGEFAKLPVADAVAYAGEDAHVAFLLDRENRFKPAVEAVYRDLELPLIDILARMELRGIGVDVDTLRQISGELGERIAELVTSIHAEAGEEFTINSPKQLQTILFEKRGLKPVKKTKTGYSTNAEVLEYLANEGDALSALVLEYRQLDKLKSTYVDSLPDHVQADGRIHTSFHQAVAATGRLSSNDPNLQNIPIRTAEGRRIRQCFRPEPGFRFLSADYSQVELRVLAHFSGDGPLVESFRSGEDIHKRTASEIFGVHLGLVSAEQRRAAKTINFGIIYGMSAFRLANQLGIGRRVAQQYIDDYFARYPQVQAFMEACKEDARKKGYAETLFGRRRPVRNMDTRNWSERSAAERIAINTPVQGTAADLIKKAMIAVDRRLTRDFPTARLLLQVHDELVLEVPEGILEDVRVAVQEEMEGVAELAVPLKVDTGDGATWDEAH